ncbi:hypothetical protein ABPG74_003400 [Tetrahymena malaccensis]
MSLLKRFNHSYYILNALFMICYVSFHFYHYLVNEFSQYSWSSVVYNFKSKGNVFLSLLALLIVKYLQSCSAEQFFSSYMNIAKLTIVARYLVYDLPTGIMYSTLFMVMFLFLKRPKYLGKCSKMTPIRNEEQWQNAVKKYAKKGTKRDDSVLTFKDTNMQFVEFYRDNEELSTDTRALWAYFAEKYATNKFKFYSVDVNKVKGIYDDIDVNVAPESNEFPTLIIFEDGVLAQRYPCEDPNTYLGKQLKKWKRKAFEKFFQFHNRWFDTKDSLPEEESQEDKNEIKKKQKSSKKSD